VDPVVTELITGARSNDDGIASSLILALSNVIKNAHQNVGDKAKEACFELAEDAFKAHHDDHYILAVAGLIAGLAYYPSLLRSLAEGHLVGGTTPSALSSQAILAILSIAEESESRDPNIFHKLGQLRDVAVKIKESCASDKPNIGRPAREARELLKGLGDEEIQGVF